MSGWIIGAIIGIVIGIILVLILHYTAFKNSRLTPLYVVIIIFFAFAGGVIQYISFDYTTPDFIPTPSDQIENLTGTIEDNWENQNGGFTFEQIQQSQNDDECPSYDDQIIKLNCYDFGSYFVFSYDDKGTYQNALFYNSKNGLILDGVISTTATFDIKFQWYPLLTWLPYYDFNTFSWNRDFTKEPYYFESNVVGGHHDNMVSLSRQSAYFVDNLDSLHLLTNRDQAASYAISQIPVLTGKNVTSHFIKFGDVELIGQANEGYKKINSFYNYLYQQIKGMGYDQSRVIDASSCLCLPIPYNLQKNYPISEDKRLDYDGAEFYGVYNCSIAVDLILKKGNVAKTETQKNQQYVVEIEEDPEQQDNVVVEDVKPADVLSEVKINFVESHGSDLSSVNLSLTPIIVTFTCNEINQTKTLVIDSFEKLNKPNYILLSNNKTWHYLIDCKSLIFENYNGNFVLKSEKTTISFEYYYLSDEIVAVVGLNPLGSFDKSEIDLAANPVYIVLSSETENYRFVFDNNNDLDARKSQVVKIGKYNYHIVSTQLFFASTSGSLEITTQDKVMLFNYTFVSKESQLYTIEGTVVNYSENPLGRGFRIILDDVSAKNLREIDPTFFYIKFLFFDNNGRTFSKSSLLANYLYVDESSVSKGDVNVYIWDSLFDTWNVQISIWALRADSQVYRFVLKDVNFNKHSCYDVSLKFTKNN